MAEIKSSIGSKTFSSTGQAGNRTFEIPDESGMDSRYVANATAQEPEYLPFPQEEIKNPYYRQSAPQQYAAPPTSPTSPIRNMSVAEAEAQLAAARQEKRSGGRISPLAKQRIEYLINIGRQSKDIPIDNVVFSLRTLKSRESRDAVVESAKTDSINQLYEIRRQQLARSLYAIDGKEMAVIIGADDLESKMELLDDLGENVISALYKAFSDLTNDSNAKFGLKSEVEVKEVVEDLKK